MPKIFDIFSAWQDFFKICFGAKYGQSQVIIIYSVYSHFAEYLTQRNQFSLNILVLQLVSLWVNTGFVSGCDWVITDELYCNDSPMNFIVMIRIEYLNTIGWFYKLF